MPKQFDYNAVFTNDITALKASIEMHNDVLNVMDWAIESALEELEENGHLSAEASLLGEYRQAIKVLRQRGFARSQEEGQQAVTCPKCKAALKGVAGVKGDRCGWCGHEFG